MSKAQPIQYLHGYDRKEQNRLYRQAQFLRESVYRGVELQGVNRLLEVGVGVGAQTSILLELNRHLRVTGVDISLVQLQAARKHLAAYEQKGQVDFWQRPGDQLDDLPNGYDAAFLCWFLEHVPNPLEVLKQVRRKLRSQAVIYCTEVLNSSLFVHPYSPALLKYWFIFNDHQWELKGNPFIGAQLGNLLLRAGFTDITFEVRSLHCDSRQPKRRKLAISHYHDILMSAAPSLLKAKRVTPKLVREMKAELARLKRTKDSVLFDTFIRATARAP